MPVISTIANFPTTLGGTPHTGWLPPGAATPPPTPQRNVTLNLTIESDGPGYLLIIHSTDGSIHSDTWHPSLADARAQATTSFGIPPFVWTDTDTNDRTPGPGERPA